jgi:outer membrane biosynthesis protein TonB
VATSVGLGNVVPFIVPGAAAPPPPKAPPAPRVQVVKPKVKAPVVAAPTAKPKPVEVDTKPATDAKPDTQDGTTDTTGTDTTGTGTTGTGTTGTGTTQTDGTTQTGGNTQTNGTAQTDGTPAKGGQAPVANLPGADANGVTGNTGVPADQAVQN